MKRGLALTKTTIEPGQNGSIASSITSSCRQMSATKMRRTSSWVHQVCQQVSASSTTICQTQSCSSPPSIRTTSVATIQAYPAHTSVKIIRMSRAQCTATTRQTKCASEKSASPTTLSTTRQLQHGGTSDLTMTVRLQRTLSEVSVDSESRCLTQDHVRSLLSRSKKVSSLTTYMLSICLHINMESHT